MNRPKLVNVVIDKQTITATEGEVLSAVLWREGFKALSHSHRTKQPRGLFCGVGRCENCVLWNNDVKVKACLTLVETGMNITTGKGSHEGVASR